MKEQGTGRQHSLRRTTTITITTRSTNTTTGTTASDVTTIAPATTRPRRVKRGPAYAQAASLNGNAKITDYFTYPNVD